MFVPVKFFKPTGKARAFLDFGPCLQIIGLFYRKVTDEEERLMALKPAVDGGLARVGIF